MQGEARVVVATRACRRHEPPTRWIPPILEALVLPGRCVGYDTMVAVGLLRYGCRKQLGEVQAELARRGIRLSQGCLSGLCDEFLVRFRWWFESARPRWAKWVARGLVLMMDGTCDAGGPVTYRVLDAKRGVVLYAKQLPSENKDDLVALLLDVKRIFGNPRCIIRDLSSGAKAACDVVFSGVPQQECHVHFIRDVGEALLRPAYEAARRALLDSKHLARLKEICQQLGGQQPDSDPVRRSVRLWTRLLLEHVESARDATGGVPFVLPYLEVGARLRDARNRIGKVVGALVKMNLFEPLIANAKKHLDAVVQDVVIQSALLHLDRLRTWFEQVRHLMRLERASLKSRMQPDALTAFDRDAILVRVNEIRSEATKIGPKEAMAWERVVTRFEAHAPYLWVRLGRPGHQRHTNPIEGVHREGRREIRRRTGRHETGQEMERVGDHAALLANLRNPWFVTNVLTGLDLVGVFRAQDPAQVSAGMAALRRRRWRDRLPVRAPARAGLLDEFAALLAANASPELLTAWSDRVEGTAATAS